MSESTSQLRAWSAANRIRRKVARTSLQTSSGTSVENNRRLDGPSRRHTQLMYVLHILGALFSGQR
jgi:hypothetical protein